MLCIECGKELKNISSKHLKKCCNLTQKEYKEKHGVKYLVDSDVRKSYGLPMERNPKWKNGATYKDCKICGKKLSKHSYVLRCVKCVWVGRDNPFLGKEHTDETKLKMSESAKKRDRSKDIKHPVSEKQRKFLSDSAKKYWANMSKEEKSKKLENFIKAGIQASRKSSETRIENFVNDILKLLNIKFSRNKYIKGKVVDFLLDGKIIECYGDYWHCNPLIYDGSFYNKSLHMFARDKWEKDKKRLDFLNGIGYKVKVFWETDIKQMPDVVRKSLEDFISC